MTKQLGYKILTDKTLTAYKLEKGILPAEINVRIDSWAFGSCIPIL